MCKCFKIISFHISLCPLNVHVSLCRVNRRTDRYGQRGGYRCNTAALSGPLGAGCSVTLPSLDILMIVPFKYSSPLTRVDACIFLCGFRRWKVVMQSERGGSLQGVNETDPTHTRVPLRSGFPWKAKMTQDGTSCPPAVAQSGSPATVVTGSWGRAERPLGPPEAAWAAAGGRGPPPGSWGWHLLTHVEEVPTPGRRTVHTCLHSSTPSWKAAGKAGPLPGARGGPRPLHLLLLLLWLGEAAPLHCGTDFLDPRDELHSCSWPAPAGLVHVGPSAGSTAAPSQPRPGPHPGSSSARYGCGRTGVRVCD